MTKEEKTNAIKNLYPHYKKYLEAINNVDSVKSSLLKYSDVRDAYEKYKNEPKKFEVDTEHKTCKLLYQGCIKNVSVNGRIYSLKELYTVIGALKKELKFAFSKLSKAEEEYYKKLDLYEEFYNDYNIDDYIKDYSKAIQNIDAKKVQLKNLEVEVQSLRDEIARLEEK